MHPAPVRLSAVVALAASLTAFPALAFATPPSLGAAQHRTSSNAERQAPAPSSTHDMEGMPAMEGMDHGGAVEESGDDPAGEHSEHNLSTQDSDGHAPAATPAPRPRAAVLSAFAGVNAAVLVAAAVLRRRDRHRPRHRPRPAATPTAA